MDDQRMLYGAEAEAFKRSGWPAALTGDLVAKQIASAPKEIGFLTRAEGLCAGLDELHARLEALTGRIAGSGVEAGGSPSAPCTSGLHAALSMAEDRLRECLKLLGKLNNAF
jgi:hypothetical protein